MREADLDINDLVCNYCDNPLLVICEVQASDPCHLSSVSRHPIWCALHASR